MSRALRRPATKAELDHAAHLLGIRAQREVSLAPLTTYKVGGAAALYMQIGSIDDLEFVSSVLAQVDLPLLVIGRGSNMLVADAGFKGLALTFGNFLEYIDLPDNSERDVEPIALFGGSVSLPVAARQSSHRGLSGLEWGVGVPGSVGGAVRMNAGGHGSDMATALVSARIFHLRKGVEAHVDALDLGLRFRGSAIAEHHVVLSATLNLSWAKDVGESEAQLAEIVKWRRENQPGGQNAGSVFVNPVPGEVSAGALIDQIGMRGFRIGTAEVSEKHANFIQADAGGLAADVVQVMAQVRRLVKEASGYDLRSEIRLAGFDSLSDPLLAEVLTSESDTSVATVRLEHVFDRNSSASTNSDTSIPLSILTSTSFVAPIEISSDVFAELKLVFGDADPSTEQPIMASITDITSREVTSATQIPVTQSGSAATSDASEAQRVVIIDDDFYQPTETDFPSDADSQSVHQAPTSMRVLITDDDVHKESNADIIVGTNWKSKTGVRKWTLWLWQATIGKFVGGNRRKKLLAIGGIAAAVIGIALVVLASPLVAVSKVDVQGARYADAKLISSVAASLKGKSVLTVDTKTAQRRLESDPWVESVRISTALPNRVMIEIHERIPVAWFLGVDNRARVIDAQGLVLSVQDGRPTNYLLIEGTGPNLIPGATANDAYRAAGQLAISIPVELQPMVKNLGVSGPNQITMTLTSGTLINFGEPVDMRNKLVNVVVLLRRQDSNTIVGIDVSTGIPVVQS